MKKTPAIAICWLLCFSAIAMDKNNGYINSSVNPAKYNEPIYNHPLRDYKKFGILARYERALRKCYEANSEEICSKLDHFIKQCVENNLNPNEVHTSKASPLKLACYADQEGTLFSTLLGFPIFDNDETLFEIAYTAKNYTILKIMANKGFLSARKLLRLIKTPELKNERHYFFHCFMEYFEDYISHIDLETYFNYIKVASEIDYKGEEFDRLLEAKFINPTEKIDPSVRANRLELTSEFAEELFQIAWHYKNYEVLKLLAFYRSLTAKQLLLLITNPELRKVRRFMLRCFTDNLSYYSKNTNHDDYLRFIKLACEIDLTGEDFEELLKEVNRSSILDSIDGIFQIACDNLNYIITDIMESNFLLNSSQITRLYKLKSKKSSKVDALP